MKSGFVQLVVKRVIGGRNIQLQQKSPRYRPIDTFKTYLSQTLPTLQQSTQINILKKTLQKIPSPTIRKQLINAYLRRLFRLRMYEKQEIKNYKNVSDVEPEAISNIVDPTIVKDLGGHGQYDVGFYCLFGEEDMGTVFKHGCFGRYAEQEWASTRKFGVQIREQSVSIAAIMKLITSNTLTQKTHPFTFHQYTTTPKQTQLNHINNEHQYPILFMQLSNQIYSYVQKFRGHAEYQRVWGSSVVSDVVTNSVLRGLAEVGKLGEAVQVAHGVVDAIMGLEKLPSPNDFSYRFKVLPGSPEGTPIKTQVQLPQNARYYCRTPSFKSLFLGGQGGTGKSMILTYLTMYAHKNNWITITVPNAYNWTQNRKTKYVRAYNGLYLINQHAVQWLDQFITANKGILEGRKVDLGIYGKCDITGVREDQAQPVPNIYIEERRTYFNEISDQFTNRLQQQQQQLRQQAKKRLTLILKSPKNIYEIGVAGIKNPEYATCAMGEILNQVYNIKDIPILECVDSFSYLYRASCYPSFRYYNDRDLWGRIPPYHIAHCRMFVNLDGHKLVNGIKVVASSNYPMYMHKFSIKQMMFPENYQHKVRNLTPSQFKNAAQFNILNDWWPADEVQRLNLMYAYTLTQGNWGDFQELMRLGHYY